MELIVEKKSVYGNQLIYPVCNKAKLFASISGNKTLLPEVIEDIKKLGYKLTTKESKYEEHIKGGKLKAHRATRVVGRLYLTTNIVTELTL
jgi:hypothetical protein